ncbi:MAG: universal stress protein [Hyphomicrobiales bacterium]|jgi:nucleotide-binding universal stress UspA family protein|nr:universal stress protein [Alphaproteobacteria bacterium]MDG1151789.1 universal stress protein [Hyphomicrobiales bacterium]MDG1524327.1 universal stress protein [Hyphomicrobiales bacterium]MDG1664834.1 universal stress protein [Hyphomicrobiales bacterium]MDG2413006.1 universal stress protein [Hyphomicrobiales bacterium]|tara:strand:- start:6350 stop:6814 length:465 start_codon:yes stop_codon:yes gene_type:complete
MKEIFLAVFDGTDECKSAVRYAARRAQLNNANLLIVATVDTAEFTYWLSVNSKMIDNIEKESKEMLKVLSKEIQSYSNVECSYIIEHGSKLDVVKRLIDEDETISLLVLASNKKDKNPGVLVETISGDGYSIPVVVLPGNLNDDSIDKLSGYRN